MHRLEVNKKENTKIVAFSPQTGKLFCREQTQKINDWWELSLKHLEREIEGKREEGIIDC